MHDFYMCRVHESSYMSYIYAVSVCKTNNSTEVRRLNTDAIVIDEVQPKHIWCDQMPARLQIKCVERIYVKFSSEIKLSRDKSRMGLGNLKVLGSVYRCVIHILRMK